jgi:hypothetical protein
MKSGRARVIVLLVVGVLLMPLAAAAQQAEKVYRIGYLSPRSGIDAPAETFRQALGQLGYIRLRVDCILGLGVVAVAALKQSTATIPIVIGAIDADPVEKALSRASRARAGTSRVSPTSRMTWRANGWSS